MFSELDFSNTVSQIGLQVVNSSRCPDQWVGDVEYLANGFQYITEDSKDFSHRTNLSLIPEKLAHENIILIILESPHIDEYKIDSEGNFIAIGPANGATGRSLRAHLNTATLDIAKQIHSKIHRRYHLFLMNAIPYQCSLGYTLKGQKRKDRDSVFMSCWNHAKNDFTDRLRRYANEKTIIINACTKGIEKRGHQSNLCTLVDDSVASTNLFKTNYFKRCHPSSIPHWKSGRSW